MRGSIFDFVGNLDTLIAVIVGACLATGGALAAEIIQERRSRKRCQRDAARFFGELIRSIDQIFDTANETREIGDPWGAYTVSLFRVASEEAQIYARNRERLFDINEMPLRFDIHGYMLRLTAPLENLVRNTAEIDDLQTRLDVDGSLSDTAIKALEERIERLHSFREAAYRSALAQRGRSAPLIERLEAVAGAPFQARF